MLCCRCEEFAAAGCKVYATARKEGAMDGFSHEKIEKVIPFESRLAGRGSYAYCVSDSSSWMLTTRKVARGSSTECSESLVA
jgi:hypothetical protein